MALSITSLRSDVKRRFRLTTTDLDADVDASVEMAIDGLAPFVKKEVSTTTTVSSNAASVSGEPRSVYVQDTNSDYYLRDDWTFIAGEVVFISEITDGTSVKVVSYVPYDIADIADIPVHLRRALVCLASSEFALLLAGDKSAYNIYAQSNGARSVDNMMDLSNYNQTMAERLLQPLSESEGVF